MVRLRCPPAEGSLDSENGSPPDAGRGRKPYETALIGPQWETAMSDNENWPPPAYRVDRAHAQPMAEFADGQSAAWEALAGDAAALAELDGVGKDGAKRNAAEWTAVGRLIKEGTDDGRFEKLVYGARATAAADELAKARADAAVALGGDAERPLIETEAAVTLAAAIKAAERGGLPPPARWPLGVSRAELMASCWGAVERLARRGAAGIDVGKVGALARAADALARAASAIEGGEREAGSYPRWWTTMTLAEANIALAEVKSVVGEPVEDWQGREWRNQASVVYALRRAGDRLLAEAAKTARG